MSFFHNVACVLRTWSNNADIAKAVKRALDVGFRKIIVVVKDEDPAHFGSVEAWLADIVRSCPADQVTILPMRVGYSWSNALNYALDEIRRMNLKAAMNFGEPTIDYVLNVSNEVLYTSEHIFEMYKAISSDEKTGAVGVTFEGRQNGNVVDLGKSYIHPRNTMMLVRFSAYLQIGGYSPRCDQHGGQEDLDWLIRLEQMGHRWSMLDLKVRLLVGVNFNQTVKESREMKAITSIMTMNAEVVSGFAKAIQRLY